MKKIILIIVFLLAIVSVNAYIYQEDADAYYSNAIFAGMSGAAIDSDIDGNYSTAAGNATLRSYRYVNYSTYLNADNNSLWQVKYCNGGSINCTGTNITNLSITNCFNSSIIQLRYFSDYYGGKFYTGFECLNVSNQWKHLINNSNTNGYAQYIYEEGIYWNIAEDTTPPEFILIPENATITDNEPVIKEFTATDAGGIDTWFINDTSYFSITAGFLSIIAPPNGVYILNVSVNDTSNNIASVLYKITVEKTEPVIIENTCVGLSNNEKLLIPILIIGTIAALIYFIMSADYMKIISSIFIIVAVVMIIIFIIQTKVFLC